MQAVTEQPIKFNQFVSNSLESLLAPTRRPESQRTLGTRLRLARACLHNCYDDEDDDDDFAEGTVSRLLQTK